MEKTLASPPIETLTQNIKRWAKEIGFYSVGILPASALFEKDSYLEDWNRRGYAASMQYMRDFDGRLERLRQSFPDAKSVICLTVSYYSPEEKPDPSSRVTGRVARYAWGRDYHKVLKKKLKTLIQRIQEYVGEPVDLRPFVDTGPILERKLAAKAGLGFIGKNTTLIGPAGSYLFLAELVTPLELVYDIPQGSFQECGNCTLCLEACPTGAIREPFVLDANRCISYLTIEHRGPIHPSLHRAIGNWVFGCDICIDVCPFNARPLPTLWEELRSERGVGSELNLEGILLLDEAGFRNRFQGTALLRAKWEGLRRNAEIVLNTLKGFNR